MTWTLISTEAQAALARAIRAADPEAGDAFVRLFAERIRVMMEVRLHDREAARELTQEALFAAWHAVREGRLRDPERLAPFVLATARNVLNGYRRARAGAPRIEPMTEEVGQLTARCDDERLAYRGLVVAALKGLSAEDRLVLRLTLVDGLRPREIAARLGLSMDAARARKSRALKRIVEAIATLSRKTPGRY